MLGRMIFQILYNIVKKSTKSYNIIMILALLWSHSLPDRSITKLFPLNQFAFYELLRKTIDEINTLLTESNCKNMSLYGHAVGCFIFI